MLIVLWVKRKREMKGKIKIKSSVRADKKARMQTGNGRFRLLSGSVHSVDLGFGNLHVSTKEVCSASLSLCACLMVMVGGL